MCCPSLLDAFQTVPHWFPLVLDWSADTLRNTGRKGVDRIVDKQPVGTGGRRGKKNNPDVTPGLKEDVTTHLAKVSCQPTIVNRFVHPPGLEPGTH